MRPGIDELERTNFAAVRGQRVGLITNHTGLTRDGRTTVAVLAATDECELVALFSPEHGFTGQLDQAVIDDASHGATGLRIHSLYGETRVPTAAMLEGIDTLVFDIQDIGCRFYTYISTMKGALEAAAKHGKRFVVLDRPNPIGGDVVAGPVLDAGRESFVGCHAIPIRHGMTVGELTRMFRADEGLEVEFEIVRCAGWRRSDWFDRTGLRWIDPSPNIRSLDQAALYPGIGLVEMTNVSVGRGTDTPFLRVGAPWVDGIALAGWMNCGDHGARFVPIEFTPTASKNANETCGGVQISITNRAELDPIAIGIELACGLQALHADAWDTTKLDRLLCDAAVAEAILSNAVLADDPVRPDIEALWADELAAFERKRAKFLLYD